MTVLSVELWTRSEHGVAFAALRKLGTTGDRSGNAMPCLQSSPKAVTKGICLTFNHCRLPLQLEMPVFH